MKVLLLNGSPKKNGCTYTALEEVAKTLQEEGIEPVIYHIGTEIASGCIGCGSCSKTGKCFRNDCLNEVIEIAKECDGFIYGSPVHYAGASGMLTAFLDRFHTAYKGMAFKPGAAVVSCRRGGAASAIDQINKYFTISNMPIVSSQYWNMVHGNTPDEVRQDLEGMQTMRVLARNMAWLLKSIEAGRAAGVCLPQQETRIKTNYIRN